MTMAINYQDFSLLSNDFIRSIPKFNLTSNQLELILFLKTKAFRNNSILILNDTIRDTIMDYLNVTRWDRCQRVLNLLQEKGLIVIEKIKSRIKITFGEIFKLKTSIRPDAFIKQPDSVGGEPCRNNILNKVLPFEKKEDNNRFLLSYIPEHKTENLEGTNFSANSISNNLSKTENLKGTNLHSTQQPTLKCHSNDVKIDCKYISALTQQMKKYNYSIQDIELTEKLIFRAKNKGTTFERINDLAKALIYNRIDKSPKRKPINDLKAFIISSLFSKEEKHIFHKLENLQNFPFESIKTNEDIEIEKIKQKQLEADKLKELELKSVHETRMAHETMTKSLQNKLKDNFEKAMEAEKKELKIKNNWFVVPEVLTVESLYNKLFSLVIETDVHEIPNTEVIKK